MHDSGKHLAQMIGQIDQLHSMPSVVARILELTKGVEYEIHDVVECLERDPALAAKILRTVNSSYFGPGKKISSLNRAVTLMGHRSLRMVVMGFGLVESLTHGLSGELINDYWRRALTMAIAARKLAAWHSSEIDPSEAYSAGLLGDLGVLLLAQVEKDAYAKHYQTLRHDGSLIDFEEQKYGFNHAVLGAYLLTRWGAPASLVNVVERHHHMPEPELTLLSVVQAGNLIADVLWIPGTPNLKDTRTHLAKVHHINMDGFIDLCRECEEEIASDSELFGVRLGAPIDCQVLLQEAKQRHQSAALESAMELDTLGSLFSDPETKGPRFFPNLLDTEQGS